MSYPFYSPEYDRAKAEVPTVYSSDVFDALGSSELQDNIESGNVTLAMIRPNLVGSTTIDGFDEEVAFGIEAEIQNLGVMAKFSIVFDEEAITRFYSGGPMEAQLEKPAERQDYNNRWEEFSELMTSGPTTVLLLYSDRGDAIDAWRAQVGHWNIKENRDPATIRGRFGVDNYNNLIHGSDSIESVQREIQIIRERLLRNDLAKRIFGYSTNVTHDEIVEKLGFDSREAILNCEQWVQKGGETFVMPFSLSSETDSRCFIAKACINIPVRETFDDWLDRRQRVNDSGLVTPELYLAHSATVIEEFIPHSVREAYKHGDQKTRQRLESSFINTYCRLVSAGFYPASLHDARSHGDDIVIIDFGEDLGGYKSDKVPQNGDLERAAERAQKEFSNLTR
ncbi:hypothetical protein KDA00_03220 [Candidatus Saccharibacteria bacterium]|nr:hypothetical protein [Candidatus Saccharibacteria bacterium]